MEARQALEAQAPQPTVPVTPRFEEPAGPAPEDPIAADRKRREYESLFASNVVLSRRPDGERPEVGQPVGVRAGEIPQDISNPSLDEIASAVLRATGGTSAGATPPAAPTTGPASAPAAGLASSADGRQERTPDRTDPIRAAGPLHTLLEGTFIDAVLTNRLDGSGTAPVNCLVTNPVYSHSGQHVLIPAGARVLGETRPFRRLERPARSGVSPAPDARRQHSLRLDQFSWTQSDRRCGSARQGQPSLLVDVRIGRCGRAHQRPAQWIGSAGYSGGTGDRTVVIAGGADAASQASLQVMSRFLNRLPTVTIREGHRVKVYVTSDLQLPAYPAAQDSVVSERRRVQ